MRLPNRPLRFATQLAVLALLPSCGGSGGTGEGSDRTMQFGPLTTRIAGTVQPPVTGGEAGVVVTGVAGGNITAMMLQDTSPTLAETRIAFQSSRDGNWEIYAMNADGSGLTCITNNEEDDSEPSWSPDATKIAFWSNRDGNEEIYKMNADGSSQTRLTNNLAIDRNPSWSPDGTKIAFDSYRDGNYEIYLVNADGSGQTRLTNNAKVDCSPCWSPDGTKIAFRNDSGVLAEIYTMNADGSGAARLTNNAAWDDNPSWSPDGTKIAFSSGRDGGLAEIYTMKADGSGQTNVTNRAAMDDNPCWSPDGTKIAFTSYPDGHPQIYTMTADGSGLTRLSNEAINGGPAWSPFLARRTLVGVGGSMGANAAGFLFGQFHAEIPSLLVFDAVTRNSARVKAQTAPGLGLPNVVFTLSADSINRLAFVNFHDTHTVTTLVGPGASVATATDAIVSFDSSNGRVSSVIPYTANRSAAPTFALEKGARVIRGRFLGAWDGKGKNRAPNGASEVRMDAKTGEIVGVK